MYKYRDIRDRVLAAAMNAPNDLLPSEHEICRQYRVSRTTAMKALNSLADDHLARREVGRGTYLNRRRVRTVVHLLVNGSVEEIMTFARDAARAFNARHPSIEMRPHGIHTSHWIREITSLPGEKVIIASHVGFLSAMGLLEPLDSLDGFSDVTAKMVSDQIVLRKDTTGTLHCDALPFLRTADVLAYNPAIAEELGLDAANGPKDWNDMADWAQRAHEVTRHGGPVMGAPIKRNNLLPMSYLYQLQDGKPMLVDNDGQVSFPFTNGVRWLRYFRDLHRSGAMPVYTNERPDPILFGNALLSPWANTWINPQQERYHTAEPLMIRALPRPRDNAPCCAQIGGDQVAIVRNISAGSRELGAAWECARYLVADPEPQRLLVSQFGGISPQREVFAEQQRDERYRPFIEALSTGVLRSDHPLQHPIMRILYKYFYAAVLGDMPCEQAAAKISEACALQIEIAP
jgi:ABC-type glycerol-3-phosphate transport system substrate-binding protein